MTDYDLESKVLIEALRKAKGLQETPVPEMSTQRFGDVTHVMAPSTGSLVASALNRGLGNYQEGQTRQQQRELSAQQQGEYDDMLGQLNTPGQGDPLAESRRRMGVYGKMSRLPMAAQMAQAGIKSEVDFPERFAMADAAREERSAARSDTQQFQAAQQQERLAESRQRAQDAAALRLQIAQMSRNQGNANADIQRQILEARLAGIESKNAEAARGKPVPKYLDEEATSIAQDRRNLNQLSTGFRDEFAGGPLVQARQMAGNLAGGTADKKTQEISSWWQQQAYFDKLPERYRMFGASLTASEKQSWDNATINPRMSPEKIRENLMTRQRIMDLKKEALMGRVQAGGYNVEQASAPFQAFDVPDLKVVPVSSLEEAKKLPSGTNFELNGQVRTRK